MSSNLDQIIYDARCVESGMTGVGRYALNLLRHLARLEETPPIRAFFTRETAERARRDRWLQGVRIEVARFGPQSHPAGDLWTDWVLPRASTGGGVTHGPAFRVPRRGGPHVVTIHDLFVWTMPEAYPAGFRWWLRRIIRQACREARRIIVPSQAVADQLIERQLASRERIRPIHHGPDATDAHWEGANGDFFPAHVLDPRIPLLMSIGARDPRKDPATARRAMLALRERRPGTRLLPKWIWIGAAGSRSDPAPEQLKRRAREAGFVETGPLPASDVQAVLRRATALVSCSRDEGFGIPLVEAMAAGVPLVISDIAVHREVAGHAALYFPPGDVDALVRQCDRLLRDASLRRRLQAAGRDRSAGFSWERAARQTLEVYREAAAD